VKYEPGLGERIKCKHRNEIGVGKVIRGQSWIGPEILKNLWLPDFKKICTLQVVR
jgi:hypothetical protein